MPMPDPLLCIVVHVHYPDTWEEISGKIAAVVPVKFHLVLTTGERFAQALSLR